MHFMFGWLPLACLSLAGVRPTITPATATPATRSVVARSALPEALDVATDGAPDGVRVLARFERGVVLAKPGSVPCHAADYVGRNGRDDSQRRPGATELMPTPLVRRGRELLLGRKLNLVHRLDRGASGCDSALWGGGVVGVQSMG